jgi:hypothetical protein
VAHIGQKLALRPASRIGRLRELLKRRVGTPQFFCLAVQLLLRQSAIGNVMGDSHRANNAVAPVAERNLIGEDPHLAAVLQGRLFLFSQQRPACADDLLFIRKLLCGMLQAEEVVVSLTHCLRRIGELKILGLFVKAGVKGNHLGGVKGNQ